MTIVIEGFEDIPVSLNAPTYPGTAHFIMPGYSGPYAFPSGVQVLSPLPNNISNPKVMVGDFLRASYNVSLGTNGLLASGDVPHGSSYFLGIGEVSLGFDIAVYAVSALVDSPGDVAPGMIAYDKTGHVISGAQIRSVAAANWEFNEIQILSKVPIAKLTFTSEFSVVDDLTFDTAKPKIVRGTNEDDRLNAGGVRDAAGTSDKDELIHGRKGNDKITARGGDDTIDGGKGNDKVKAGDGNDTLIAGDGNDKLRGEAGQDSFLFTKLGGMTTLRDFDVFDDTILLSRAAFPGLEPGQVSANQIVHGTLAADADDRLIYNPATGILVYDPDGNGPGVPTAFAKLPLGLTLTQFDFLAV